MINKYCFNFFPLSLITNPKAIKILLQYLFISIKLSSSHLSMIFLSLHLSKLLSHPLIHPSIRKSKKKKEKEDLKKIPSQNTPQKYNNKEKNLLIVLTLRSDTGQVRYHLLIRGPAVQVVRHGVISPVQSWREGNGRDHGLAVGVVPVVGAGGV